MLPESFTPQYLRQIEQLRIHSRRSFLGSRQGGHLSLKRGHGMEFADYRKYEPGDDPRHIDWGVFARSDRLYVKQFREEEDLSVIIILDASASMGVPAAENKWEMARDIALTLSYIALMEQDTVSFSVLNRFHRGGFSGAKAFHSLCGSAMSISPEGSLELQNSMRIAAARIRFPGKAVVISDFLAPFEEIHTAVNMLRAKNLDISCIQVLGQSDITPLKDRDQAVVVDSETGKQVELALDEELREKYDYLFFSHNEKLRRFLNKHQISFTQTVSNRNLSDFVVNNLLYIGLLK